MKRTNEDKYSINTLSNVFDVLDCFQYGNCELGVSEISKTLNLSKNMVFRLLMNLKSRNFIEQNEKTGKYLLGLKNYVLGQAAIRISAIYCNAQVIVDELRNEINETCYYSVLRDKSVQNICTSESSQLVRVVQEYTMTSPLHCTAAGKLLVACKDRGEMVPLVGTGAFQKYTPSTITDLFELKKELSKIQMQGYALENQEYEHGVFAVAAPVMDFKEDVIGAVSICVPTCRLTDERIENELVPKAIRAANELSEKLGYLSEFGCTVNRARKHS